ncbi:MAG: threonylcarbamoyl-AMP synthase [Erysipelotrichaceae bacterium]|nr:threonylcarbamoyl-AMP synthase [Erysipelotrichaceae bacterium]
MKTLILEQSQIKETANLLKQGEIVAFPTETVFGLGAIYSSKQAYDKLAEIKKRPKGQLFTVMVASRDDVENYAVMTPLIEAITEKFLIGPLTIIVPAKSDVPSWIKGEKEEIGIRISSMKYVRDLIKEVGQPLLVPSANITGTKPAVNAKEAYDMFNNVISGVVKGESVSRTPSTIIRISDKIELVREGAITLQSILKEVEDLL